MAKTTISTIINSSGLTVTISKDGATVPAQFPIEFSYKDKAIGDKPYIVMLASDFEVITKFIAQAQDALSRMK